MNSRTLKFNLSPEAKKIFASQFSSENYSSTAQSLLVPFDLLYTYIFRYQRVVEADLSRAQGHDPQTEGAAIDYTSSHPALGVAISASFASIAIISSYFHLNSLKKAKEINSTHFIKKQLDELAEAEKNKPQLLPVFDVNFYLAQVLKSRPEMQAKYASIAIEGEQLKIALNEDTKTTDEKVQPTALSRLRNLADNVTRKFISPAWEALSLTSYSYWIMWIGAGIFTGKFSVGVEGLSPVLGFGIPILVGLSYPIVKIYNYFKNRHQKSVGVDAENAEVAEPEVIKTAEKDVTHLMRSALLLREYEYEKANLQSILLEDYGISEEPVIAASIDKEIDIPVGKNKIDANIATLGSGRWKKSAVTFLSAMAGTFVGAQYGAWVVSDFLNIVAGISIGAPIVQIAVGTVLMAGAFAYGLYKAIERYYEVKGHADNLKKVSPAQIQQNELTELEKQLENSHKNISTLADKLGLSQADVPRYDQEYFLNDVSPKSPTLWSTVKNIGRNSLQFFNGMMTGAFIARVFFVKGTAIALPFAAAALSNPITIGVLVGLAVAFGTFKLYQYHQQRKEEHAKLLLDQRAERIQCLKQEVVIAGLKEKLYSAMANKMDQNAVSKDNAKTAATHPLTLGIQHTILRPRSYSVGDQPIISSKPLTPKKNAA